MTAAFLYAAAAQATDLSGTISGSVSLPAGQHRLVGPLTIAASGRLTLQAGAALKVAGNYGISVYGTLRALGTAGSRCAITAQSSAPGAWPGIFAFSGATIRLVYTTVSHARVAVTANSASLDLDQTTITDCSLDGVAVYNSSSVSLDNCSFASIGRRGLFLETTSVTGTVGACQFTDIGEYPVVAKATLVELLVGPLTVVSAAIPYVGVSCSADEDILDADTWKWLGIDYDLTAGSSDELNVAPTGRLTIEPGVRLRCDRIRVEGELAAGGAGSATHFLGPAGESGTPGDWPGIEVAGGTLSLTNTTIRNAHTGITADDATLTLHDCWIDASQYDGLWATGSTQIDFRGGGVRGAGRSAIRLVSSDLAGEIRDCLISGCADWPVYAVANAVGVLGPDITFSDNDVAAIGVNCSLTTDISTNQTWRPQPLPYDLSAEPSGVVARVARGTTLTIEAGAQVLNGGLDVRGSLIVAGTSEYPVLFSSSRQPPAPGDTPGIEFGPGSTGTMSWAVIEYADTGVNILDSSPRLEHLRIWHNSAHGIRVSGSSASPVIYRCSIVDNGQYGVMISDGAAPVLGNLANGRTDDDGYNELWGNLGPYDLYNQSPSLIRAENNWWGTSQEASIRARIFDQDDSAPSGPVDFIPYRSGPPNTPPQLDWLATGPYQGTGVSPEAGTPTTTFVWKVRYSDADGNPPQWVRVHIACAGQELAGSPFDMTLIDNSPDYRRGVVFKYQRKLPASRDYSYWFEAMDWELRATGPPTQPRTGPLVSTPPTLQWTGESGFETDGVDPDSGFADETLFEFRVKYIDPDGDQPVAVHVHILLRGREIPGSPFEMSRVSGDPPSGAIYRHRLTLHEASAARYEYRFSASDGLFAAGGQPTEPAPGPSVRYRPNLTYVGSVGYELDGVEPQAGQANTTFHFKVVYRHRGGRAPATIRVHVASAGQEIAGSPFDMQPADNNPVQEGRVYAASVRLAAGRHYTHWFEASDGRFDASGPATQPAAGPLADRRPQLSFPNSTPFASDGLDPHRGGTGATEFTWRVVYRDADGDPPLYVAVRLYLDGQELPGSPCAMRALVGGTFEDGITYELRKRLGRIGRFSYRFVASDGYLEASGAPTQLRSGPRTEGAFELTFPEIGGMRSDGLYPDRGRPDSTPFTFAVKYRHVAAVPPTNIVVHIRANNRTDDITTYNLSALDTHPFDEGRTYARTITLPKGNYSYWFEASDGEHTGRTDELPGPRLNTPPVLEWVGEGGWKNDGVDPNVGSAGTTFVFRVRYTDSDGDMPQTACVALYTGPDHQWHSWQDMQPEQDGDPRSGIVYCTQATLPQAVGGWSYRFVFDDGYGGAVGEPCSLHSGPHVRPSAGPALAVHVLSAHTGPRMATIALRLPSATCRLQAQILNLAGRTIARMVPSNPAGRPREAVLCWNYTNLHGVPVPAGLYVAVIEVHSPSGTTARRVVTLNVKR